MGSAATEARGASSPQTVGWGRGQSGDRSAARGWPEIRRRIARKPGARESLRLGNPHRGLKAWAPRRVRARLAASLVRTVAVTLSASAVVVPAAMTVAVSGLDRARAGAAALGAVELRRALFDL